MSWHLLAAWILLLGELFAGLVHRPGEVPGGGVLATVLAEEEGEGPPNPVTVPQPTILDINAAQLSKLPAGERLLAERFLLKLDDLGGWYGKSSPELDRLRVEYVRAAAPGVFRAGALFHLADAAKREGNTAAAIRFYEMVGGGPGDAGAAEEAAVEVARLLRKAGGLQAARDRLKRGPVFRAGDLKSRQDVGVNADRAAEFLALGDHEAARLAFLEGSPDPARPAAVRAYAAAGNLFAVRLSVSGHPAEAANFQRVLLDKYGDQMSPHELAGAAWTLEGAGESEAAAALRERVKTRSPDSPAAASILLQEADAAVQRQDWAAAELLARETLSAAGDDPASEGVREYAAEILRRSLNPVGYREPPMTQIAPRPDPAFSGVAPAESNATAGHDG